MPEQSDVDKLAQLFAGNLANMFKESAAYNSIIVAAGYAGAFALWNVVKGQLSDFASATVVVLLGISLTGYICWTVFMMVWNARQLQAFDRKVRGKPPTEYVEAYRKAASDAQIEHQSLFLKAWIVQFVIVLATGMMGILILLGNAAAVLLTNH